ncbi:hypothetical protein [Anaeromyxobacter sp. Fw109-5]|uniref:hypothetical protein n=1 Tax=Anaeromyxobacter sp. (strain Fw109-5) TaxID=404589 RepID=UPI0000ED6EEB|nr:hypothetical protein [Anaeromyxobacter sp. Fw109-5]ABS28537.1 conserved hypothetical protein [Anaeromyxobacter sp. Fw109-5]
MALSGALTLTLALLAAADQERLLLCRPQVAGDPALARGDAVGEAARKAGGRFLDYGVTCEDAAEGARAARRAGLAYAVAAAVEGRVEGSRFVLVLADAATETERTRRTLEVAPGADAVRPLRGALRELVASLPPPPGPSTSRVAAWTVTGAGAVALAAGTLFALSARGAAADARGALDPAAYTRSRQTWEDRRRWSALSFAAGGAAVAAGLTWRFAF